MVARVGLEVARQTLLDPSPAAATDARVVKVTVDLDADSSTRARRLTNLQATARITPEKDDDRRRAITVAAITVAAMTVAGVLEALLGRLPLGWLQLVHNPVRLAAALAGVAFAVVLILMQLGFMGALIASVQLRPIST